VFANDRQAGFPRWLARTRLGTPTFGSNAGQPGAHAIGGVEDAQQAVVSDLYTAPLMLRRPSPVVPFRAKLFDGKPSK
jgi:hypothetical protein